MSRDGKHVWRTLKVSGLYHKKVKFPLKISDRAWWLEVQVLKSQGNKSRRKNDKGPQDMEIDCIKNVTTDLSAKACQRKDVLTDGPNLRVPRSGIRCSD